MHKSCAIPISCDEQSVQEGCNVFHCTSAFLSCTYLGLPISDKKLRKSDLLQWVHKIADRLPNWKAHLLNLAGRTALSSRFTFLLLWMFLSGWLSQLIQFEKGLFGEVERRSMGSCLVSWDKVSRPHNLGGLGIPNLQYMSWALQTKCIWLQKTDPNRPWNGLKLPIQQQVRDLFAISVISHLGNGTNTIFWMDRWLNGCCIRDMAPEVFS